MTTAPILNHPSSMDCGVEKLYRFCQLLRLHLKNFIGFLISTARIGWEREDGKKIIIHDKPVLRKKRESAFNWFEEFPMEWSETFISKK